MFSKKHDINLEKEQKKNELKAAKYIDNPQKIQELLNKATVKAGRKKRALGDVWEKLILLIELIRSYYKGEYRKVSKGTILTVIGAVIYFVSPVDIIPDFITGLGLMDDAAVIGFAIKKIYSELDKYKKWRLTENQPPLDQ